MSGSQSASDDDGLVRNKSFPLEYTIGPTMPYLDSKIPDLNTRELTVEDVSSTKKPEAHLAKEALNASSSSISDRLAVAP